MGTSYQHIVSLGSSFAAGPQIEPVVDGYAGRSGVNYGALLAKRLGAKHTDLSVSGATTENVLSKPQTVGVYPLRGKWYNAQIQDIPAEADLITITCGGNDLGYSAVTMKGAFAGWLQALNPVTSLIGYYLLGAKVPEGTDAQVEKVVAGLVAIVEEARKKAPNAKILLVDYLTVFGDDTQTHPSSNPLTEEQISALRALGRKLDSAFATAAERTGATLVKISQASASRAIGSQEPWVNAFTSISQAAPYHPNAKGMQGAADEIFRVLQDS